MQRDPVRLDPSAVKPKIQLAQLLNAKDPAQADKLIDETVAADPNSVEALQVNRERLRARLRCQYRRRRPVSRSEMEPISPVLFEGNAGQQLLFSNSGNIGSNGTFASRPWLHRKLPRYRHRRVLGGEYPAVQQRRHDDNRQRECPEGSEHPELPLANFTRGDRYRADHLVRGFGRCEFRHDGQQRQRSYYVIRTETDRRSRRVQFFSLFSGRFAAIVRTEWTDR
jgi:hypothetical protein